MVRCNNILFARFFDPYDGEGQQIPGFFENLDFSGYSETLDIIATIAADNINMYLKNEYSRRYVVSTWAAYMTWNKEEKRYDIDPAFYTAFSAAICGHLLAAENFYQLTQIDFADLPETIAKIKEYGQQYVKVEHGDDTVTLDQYQDKTTYDIDATKTTVEDDIKQHHTKTENDYAQDHTETVNDYAQDHTETVNDYAQDVTTTVDQKKAFNSSNYSDTDKSTATRSARQDQIDVTRDARQDQIDVTRDAHKDTIDVTEDAHKDVHTTDTDARKDETTFDSAEKKTTNTYGDLETTKNQYKDKENTYINKAFDREKLVKIKTELARLNAYQLIGDAVAATMLRSDFDEYIDHAGFFIPV